MSEEFSDKVSVAKTGALRIALLFGSAAVALTLILTPIAEREADRKTAAFRNSAGLDLTATGSIQKPHKTYTIRRSVLQSDASDLCVISADGSRSGNC